MEMLSSYTTLLSRAPAPVLAKSSPAGAVQLRSRQPPAAAASVAALRWAPCNESRSRAALSACHANNDKDTSDIVDIEHVLAEPLSKKVLAEPSIWDVMIPAQKDRIILKLRVGESSTSKDKLKLTTTEDQARLVIGYIGDNSPASELIITIAKPKNEAKEAAEEAPPNVPVSSSEKSPVSEKLKLLSGSCYLPHPDKEATGGEDAHFISIDEHVIGVADGVGSWADQGVDAGLYAKELMRNSMNAIKDEPEGTIDPTRVLEKAYMSTKERGSSTACIITLKDQGIHAVNLGDSGFVVVQDGRTVLRSPSQQHEFNCPYQLESGGGADLPSSAQVFQFPVAPGDVIVAGTDGLFDNLDDNEISGVIVEALRVGLEPQIAAQKIAALARQRATDENRQSPFALAAQEAGCPHRGGKLDDITVVVSYVKSAGAP